MDLEVLVSTMGQEDLSILENMNIQSNAVIINQTNYYKARTIDYNNYKIKWIDVDEKGLSKSRNLAISEATADICLFADDDLEYVENYENIIKEQFKKNTRADIIIFQVEGIEKKFRKYPKKAKKINFFTSMKVSSVEIAFKRGKIENKKIKFLDNFGSGAKYKIGEENIFLNDCRKNGLKIYYVPFKIANLHIGDSSWFKGYNEKYFFDRGASYAALSSKLCYLLILQFAIRKYKKYNKEIRFKDAIKYMMKGIKNYKKEIDI